MKKFCFILLFISVLGVKSQDLNQMQNLIANQGFENVAVLENKNTVFISFENRVYRHLPDGIAWIISQIHETMLSKEKLVLLVKDKNLEILKLEIDITGLNKALRNDSTETGLEKFFKAGFAVRSDRIEAKTINKSYGRMDIAFQPLFFQQLGDYNYPFRYRFEIVPTFSTQIGRGLSLNAEAVVPVHDYRVSDDKYIYPGKISLVQRIVMPNGFVGNFSLGKFSNNRYGYDIELYKLVSSLNMVFATKFSKTGMMYYGYTNPANNSLLAEEATLYYSDINKNSFELSATYFWPELNTYTTISYNKYIDSYKAVTVNIGRQFHESVLSFYLSRIEGENNFGFSLDIPLFLRKYSKNSIVRFRPASSFNYKYNVSNVYPVKFSTGTEYLKTLKKYSPNFVVNEVCCKLAELSCK